MSAKDRKGWKHVERTVSWSIVEGPVDSISERLAEASWGLTDANLVSHWDDLIVEGWRPMTEKELERAARARERAKISRIKKIAEEEARERATLARLKEKYEGSER